MSSSPALWNPEFDSVASWRKVVYNDDLCGSSDIKSVRRSQRRQNSKCVGLKMQRGRSQGLEGASRAGEAESFSTIAPRDTTVLMLFQRDPYGPLTSKAVR